MGGCASKHDTATPDRIVVLGASGMVGSETLKALAADPHGAEIVAGVRDPSSDKAQEALGVYENVQLGQADMGSPESLDAALAKATAVFIVVPGHEDRTRLAMNALEACERAEVQHIVLLSVLTAERDDTIFGKQFAPLEDKVKSCGVPYTIIRVPMFLENNYGHMESIKGQQMLYGPVPADKVHNPIATADIGAGAAVVLTHPKEYVNSTLIFTTEPKAFGDELKAGFSEALGTEVGYTHVPYEAAKEAFMGLGMPEWQTDGVLELMKGVEEDWPEWRETGDFQAVTGRKPQTVEEWCHANVGAFRSN